MIDPTRSLIDLTESIQREVCPVLTIGHKGVDNPQLVLCYEDAPVGENTGVVEQLGYQQLPLEQATGRGRRHNSVTVQLHVINSKGGK